jgi:hypothetical protein
MTKSDGISYNRATNGVEEPFSPLTQDMVWHWGNRQWNL